jgi:RNA polymerase sigma-70 factor, ECF subfamily
VATDIARTIEAVWRIESLRLIAGLARAVRDVGLAEDLAQDALVQALERWPSSGVPENPGAWLMTAAKRRGIDHIRRAMMQERKHEILGHNDGIEQALSPFEAAVALDEHIDDDTLRLLFVACHPVLPTDARVAFTLRMVGGLTTQEIARAFLASEATIAQRIVRAKRTLAEANVPFEVPQGRDRAARLESVLEVIYFIFNEGYSATSGEDWVRPELCRDAMRLGRILCELSPKEGETHGLIALMELQASRFPARTGPRGEPVLMQDQNRSLWDRILIRRGLAALSRGEGCDAPPGAYLIQAAIAACHARADSVAGTDWTMIVTLYDRLVEISPSPVVWLNRAVAVGMRSGPVVALELVDALSDDPSLEGYHLLPSVRADLLIKLGRFEEARDDLECAASLTQNARERTLLRERAAFCGRSEVSGA